MLHQLSKLNILHHNRKLIFFPILHYLLFEMNIQDIRLHFLQYMTWNILCHERDNKSLLTFYTPPHQDNTAE